jgi:hypothetical protein
MTDEANTTAANPSTAPNPAPAPAPAAPAAPAPATAAPAQPTAEELAAAEKRRADDLARKTAAENERVAEEARKADVQRAVTEAADKNVPGYAANRDPDPAKRDPVRAELPKHPTAQEFAEHNARVGKRVQDNRSTPKTDKYGNVTY